MIHTRASLVVLAQSWIELLRNLKGAHVLFKMANAFAALAYPPNGARVAGKIFVECNCTAVRHLPADSNTRRQRLRRPSHRSRCPRRHRDPRRGAPHPVHSCRSVRRRHTVRHRTPPSARGHIGSTAPRSPRPRRRHSHRLDHRKPARRGRVPGRGESTPGRGRNAECARRTTRFDCRSAAASGPRRLPRLGRHLGRCTPRRPRRACP